MDWVFRWSLVFRRALALFSIKCFNDGKVSRSCAEQLFNNKSFRIKKVGEIALSLLLPHRRRPLTDTWKLLENSFRLSPNHGNDKYNADDDESGSMTDTTLPPTRTVRELKLIRKMNFWWNEKKLKAAIMNESEFSIRRKTWIGENCIKSLITQAGGKRAKAKLIITKLKVFWARSGEVSQGQSRVIIIWILNEKSWR